jgi:phospholipase C
MTARVGVRGRGAARHLSWLVAGATIVAASLIGWRPPNRSADAAPWPIRHIVIVVQENHSFDNVLGRFCHAVATGDVARRDGCNGAVEGHLPTEKQRHLAQAHDIVESVAHSVRAQQVAIAGGAMNGFGLIRGCTRAVHFACYSSYTRWRIPNTWHLADRFALSDATFESRGTPSWAGHMLLASATLDGFAGNNPAGSDRQAKGWGCDSGRKRIWTGVWQRRLYTNQGVPSCVPNRRGQLGPVWRGYSGPRARYVPTILDALHRAGKSWRIYGAGGADDEVPGYQWTICPTFYHCLSRHGDRKDRSFVPARQVVTDAAGGDLPNVSIVTPLAANSQHNSESMALGDGWIGTVVGAIMSGPQWRSTVVFITWDDCGCFYDHVDPLRFNSEWGVRVPWLIVSPFAKRGFTDSTPSTFASFLAFVEHAFGLRPLNPCARMLPDASCTDDKVGSGGRPTYDFSKAFNWSRPMLETVRMVKPHVPKSERARLRRMRHPVGNGT